MTRAPLFLAVLALAVAAPAARAQDTAQQPDIIATLEASGNFTSFLAAVRSAGLEEKLKGEGGFTVFAPTDEAFSKLPEGMLADLMADPAALREIVDAHVIAQTLPSAQITEASDVETLDGSTLELNREGEAVRVRVPAPAAEVAGGADSPAAVVATVITPDLAASNGVIHAIDRVLITPVR